MKTVTSNAAGWLVARQRQEEGQTFVEYALVVALLSVGIGVFMAPFGLNIIDFANAEIDAFIGGS